MSGAALAPFEPEFIVLVVSSEPSMVIVTSKDVVFPLPGFRSMLSGASTVTAPPPSGPGALKVGVISKLCYFPVRFFTVTVFVSVTVSVTSTYPKLRAPVGSSAS